MSSICTIKYYLSAILDETRGERREETWWEALVIDKERKFEREYRASNSTLNSTFNPIDENHRVYVNFISSLKSSITKKAYVIRLKNYLRSPTISFSSFDELLSRDRCTIEQGTIDILINMRYKLHLSFSAQIMFLCGLIHFFSINDLQ